MTLADNGRPLIGQSNLSEPQDIYRHNCCSLVSSLRCKQVSDPSHWLAHFSSIDITIAREALGSMSSLLWFRDPSVQVLFSIFGCLVLKIDHQPGRQTCVEIAKR